MNETTKTKRITDNHDVNNVEKAWWMHPVFLVIVVLLFSGINTALLFGVLDTITPDVGFIAVLIAFFIAFILNIIPIAVARLKNRGVCSPGPGTEFRLFAAMLIYALLYTETVIARFYITDRESIMAVMIASVLALVPLLSSMINYLLVSIILSTKQTGEP